MAARTTPEADAAPSVAYAEDAAGELRLEFRGRLDSFGVHPVWKRVRHTLLRQGPARVIVDASRVSYCDASGATMLLDLERIQRDAGRQFELTDFPPDFQPIVDLLRRQAGENPTPDAACPECPGWLHTVGRATVALVEDARELIANVGEIVAALAYSALHPGRVRWRDALRSAQTAGVNSTPVILLVSGLLGLIMGFQSAQTLHDYGGDVFLADLLGISFLRELGPLMTGIILTARSGSAFAAEIGTMKISEEVDALRTMGANPVRFLVVPRVLAAIVMTPLLTVFANLAGLTGGLLVWVFTLNLSLPSYLAQLEKAVELSDLITGLVKAMVFGTLVAGIGCIRGMQTSGSASAVGAATTSSVVSGIVLIALCDAMFTVLFHFLEI